MGAAYPCHHVQKELDGKAKLTADKSCDELDTCLGNKIPAVFGKTAGSIT